jgi:nucleotide-binding universal stress UspA family protein
MFKHLLVPLDGSQLAESALPFAASLGETLAAKVTLLHVIEKGAPDQVHQEPHLTAAKEANAYLAKVARRDFPREVAVDWHVHARAVPNVVDSIVLHAQKDFQPDLIVLCSHGRSGMRDIVSSSIAQQVVAGSTIPVLLVKPKDGRPAQPTFRKILVPLDNESAHDQSLPIAKDLAQAYRAEITMICVIPTLTTLSGEKAVAGTLLPGTAAAYLEMTEENARQHFQEHLKEFKTAHLSAQATIARGDPVSIIAKTAQSIDADLILFATHGSAGFEAFWRGSVAANVARRTDIPLLLIPLPRE